MSKCTRDIKITIDNEKFFATIHIDVEFYFYKGYPQTYDEPGMMDDVETISVTLLEDFTYENYNEEKDIDENITIVKGTNMIPLLNKDDIVDIEAALLDMLD